jgi:hypothetical protein
LSDGDAEPDPPELNEVSSEGLVVAVVTAVLVVAVVDDVAVVDGVASILKKVPSSPRSSLLVLGLSVWRNPSRKCILATTLLLLPPELPDRSSSEADSFRSIGFGCGFGFESSPSFVGRSLTTGELGSDIVVVAGSFDDSDISWGLLLGRTWAEALRLEVATSTTSHR